jgi:hypothetical protein
MAYVVRRPKGRWELRRSQLTKAGPRSETLLTFRELTGAGTLHALQRAGGDLTAEQVESAARRAGAPIALAPARRSALELLRELHAGATLPESWRAALRSALTDAERDSDEAAQTITAWADASAEKRGNALRDLLLLADAIPTRQARGDSPRFPGFLRGTGEA